MAVQSRAVGSSVTRKTTPGDEGEGHNCRVYVERDAPVLGRTATVAYDWLGGFHVRHQRRGSHVSAKKKPGNRRRTWLLVSFLVLLVVLGGTWVGAYFAAGDQIPAKASVDGVAIGGLTPDAAVEKLQDEVGPRYATPVTVAAAEGEGITLEPLESGLSLDYEGAVQAAGGGASWNPVDIWRTFMGGAETQLLRKVDQEQLAAVLEQKKAAFATESVDASLAYEEAPWCPGRMRTNSWS